MSDQSGDEGNEVYPGMPGPAPTYGPPAPAYGTPALIGDRLLAYLIDGLVMFVGLIPVFALLVIVATLGFNVGGNVGDTLGGILVIMVYVVVFVLAFAYQIMPVARLGQTVGRRVMGVQIVDSNTGATIGMGRAFLRMLVFQVTVASCYIGLISYFIDGSKRNRAWHDMAAADVVIRVPKSSLGESIRTVLRTMRP